MRDDDLRPLPHADTWHTRAACHPDRRPNTMTPAEWTAIFYPIPEAPIGRRPKGQATANLYDPARAICAGCPVQDPCLKAAMQEEKGGRRFGMRAGLTWRERSALPRRTCRWCGDWFDVKPLGQSGGRLPHFCTPTCKERSREQRRIEENERQRVTRWRDDNTECEVCGFEARNLSGLAAHRRQLHGRAA